MGEQTILTIHDRIPSPANSQEVEIYTVPEISLHDGGISANTVLGLITHQQTPLLISHRISTCITSTQILTSQLSQLHLASGAQLPVTAPLGHLLQ